VDRRLADIRADTADFVVDNQDNASRLFVDTAVAAVEYSAVAAAVRAVAAVDQAAEPADSVLEAARCQEADRDSPEAEMGSMEPEK